MPELCVPAPPAPPKSRNAPPPVPAGPLPTLTVRVGRIEAVVNAMIGLMPELEGQALDQWRISK